MVVFRFYENSGSRRPGLSDCKTITVDQMLSLLYSTVSIPSFFNNPVHIGRTRCVARARSNQYDTVRERTLQSLVALLEKKSACKKLWFTMNQAKLNKVKRESHPNNRLLRQHQMHDSRTPVWIKGTG